MGRFQLGAQEQQAILALNSHAEQYRSNHDIVTPGEVVDHACLVSHGLIARYDQMRSGPRQVTAFHIEGDMCDLHSVVCPTAAWGIVALSSATTVLRVPHAGLKRLVTEYPAIAVAFWRDGTADASVLAKWVGNLGRRGSRARVAHLLCEMGVRMEVAGVGARKQFWFDATQTNLADAVGLTPVHVNRTLQMLRSDGLIRTQSRIIYVDDWPALARCGDFDGDYLLLSCDSPSGKGADGLIQSVQLH